MDSGESPEIPVKTAVDISNLVSGKSDVLLKFHGSSQGNIIWVFDDITIVSGEISPPEIALINAENSCHSEQLLVQAQISDESGVSESIFKYRVNGGIFAEEPMVKRGEFYEVQIAHVTTGLLEYQLIARDNSVNKNIAHSTGLASIDSLWIGSIPSSDYQLNFTEADNYRYLINRGSKEYSWEHFIAEGGDSVLYLNLYEIRDTVNAYTFQTSPIHLTAESNVLAFDYAYAPYRDNYDTLEISISVDGGTTWEGAVYSNYGSDLATSGPSDTPFFPQKSHWSTDYINLSSYIGECLIVKFSMKSGDGNNFFIDNIRFENGEIIKTNLFVSQNYPNPTSGLTRIDLDVPSDGEAQLSILDTQGKLVREFPLDMTRKFTIELNLQDLNNGIYLYRIQSGQNSITKRLIKQ